METVNQIKAPGGRKEPVHIDGYLTESQLGARLGKGRTQLWRWRKRGIGPKFTRIGQTVYYREIGVDEWLLGLERSPKAQARIARRKRVHARANTSRAAASAD
jgi:predicted DNA-binding transcriptional regulator AlpA